MPPPPPPTYTHTHHTPHTQITGNPLIVTLEGPSVPRSKRTNLWFSKSEFSDLQNDQDEDVELHQMVESYKNAGGQLWSRNDKQNVTEELDSRMEDITSVNGTLNEETPSISANRLKKKSKPVTPSKTNENQDEESDFEDEENHQQDGGSPNGLIEEDDASDSSDDMSSSSDEDDLHISRAKMAYAQKRLEGEDKETKENESLEVVPIGQELGSRAKRKLDPEGLAMGALMIQSKKKREDLVDSGYNRWTSNDDNLPDWFVKDEAKFCTKQIPISKEMVEMYRAKLKDINSRPIKKIAEAKARKKKRALRKLEKVRKRAEVIADAPEVSSNEKAQQLRHIYKKAGLADKKKEVQYVVAKKRSAGKRVPRPAGVKGHYKVVDPRMKKDNRSKQTKTKSHVSGQRKRKR